MSEDPNRPYPASGPTEDSGSRASYRPGGANSEYPYPTPRRGVAPPKYAPQSSSSDWAPGPDTTQQVESDAEGGRGVTVIALLALASIALCITGFFVGRVFLSDPTPALPPAVSQTTPSPWATGTVPQVTPATSLPGQLQMAINPTQGYVNTLITVTGQGWWPGEPVFVFLRSREDGEGQSYAYAAAVADDQGSIHTALTFPNEMRWIGEEWADVLARGSRSGLEASARFTLVSPTATNTSPPPTAGPTSPVTATPQTSATPLSTDTPIPTATPVVITDWRGEYYANAALAGGPALVRNDLSIDYNWGAGSPDPRLPADQFSVRWMRQVGFEQGQYRIVVSSDDGVRLWVDGQLVMDEWHDGTLTDYSVNLDMSQGKHFLQLEYYENSGGAMVRLSWEEVELPTVTPTTTPTLTPTPTPALTLTPTPAPTDTPLPTDEPAPTDTPSPTSEPPTSTLPDRWQAHYFANPLLGGDPVLVREDSAIQFDWGEGSPGPEVPADGFSARWTGEVWLSGGEYQYALTADEGAGVWIDGQPLLLAWPTLPGRQYRLLVQLSEGTHVFVVEYYEGTGQASIHLWD